MLRTKVIWFVGGGHKSGTTFVRDVLAQVEEVSTFTNTGAPSDEGQHLQSSLKSDWYLGEILFGLSEEAYESEVEPRQAARFRIDLGKAWAPWWDLSKPYLLEKSPINIVRTRWLQSVFPAARFVIVARDPRVAFLAARKTLPQLNPIDYFTAWQKMYTCFEQDSSHLRRSLLVRFEDLAWDWASVARTLSAFLDVPVPTTVSLDSRRINSYRGRWSEYYLSMSDNERALIGDMSLPLGYDLDP